VANPEIHNLWSSLVSPFMECEVEHFAPDQIPRLADVARGRRRRLKRGKTPTRRAPPRARHPASRQGRPACPGSTPDRR
jgi:hypothetical protein